MHYQLSWVWSVRLSASSLNNPTKRHKRHEFDLWVGKIPGVGNSNPLQYAYLGNPRDRGAWQATVHRVAESRTRLSPHTTLHGASFLDVETDAWRGWKPLSPGKLDRTFEVPPGCRRYLRSPFWCLNCVFSLLSDDVFAQSPVFSQGWEVVFLIK